MGPAGTAHMKTSVVSFNARLAPRTDLGPTGANPIVNGFVVQPVLGVVSNPGPFSLTSLLGRFPRGEIAFAKSNAFLRLAQSRGGKMIQLGGRLAAAAAAAAASWLFGSSLQTQFTPSSLTGFTTHNVRIDRFFAQDFAGTRLFETLIHRVRRRMFNILVPFLHLVHEIFREKGVDAFFNLHALATFWERTDKGIVGIVGMNFFRFDTQIGCETGPTKAVIAGHNHRIPGRDNLETNGTFNGQPASPVDKEGYNEGLFWPRQCGRVVEQFFGAIEMLSLEGQEAFDGGRRRECGHVVKGRSVILKDNEGFTSIVVVILPQAREKLQGLVLDKITDRIGNVFFLQHGIGLLGQPLQPREFQLRGKRMGIG